VKSPIQIKNGHEAQANQFFTAINFNTMRRKKPEVPADLVDLNQCPAQDPGAGGRGGRPILPRDAKYRRLADFPVMARK
jgi:hypothetical protein